MSYKPQLTTPKENNPYYNTTSNNGYSKCIVGNSKKKCFNKKLNVLPNCVGYIWGRFNEIAENKEFKYYTKGNAEDILNKAKSNGLEIGTEPKVGAIICWKSGKVGTSSDGLGHVAIVEQILDKDTILIAQSGWSSDKLLWTATHKIGNGNWVEGDDYNWMKSNYKFQGFIYNPNITDKWGTCPYTEPKKAIKKGAKGNNVKWLQWHMNRLGYSVEIDGSFGNATDTTLRIIQKKYKLVSDGICGTLTRKKIKSL